MPEERRGGRERADALRSADDVRGHGDGMAFVRPEQAAAAAAAQPRGAAAPGKKAAGGGR